MSLAEGNLSLARSALASSTACVVGCSWQVSEALSAIIAKLFYEACLQGHSVSTALRQALLFIANGELSLPIMGELLFKLGAVDMDNADMEELRNTWRHPAFWAAYSAFGCSWRPMPWQERSGQSEARM